MSSSGADQNKAERQEADGTREELRAILSARQELGTEYNDELADMLMERLDAVIDSRVEARLQSAPKSSLSPAVPICSFVFAVPLTPIAADMVGLMGVAIVWAALVVINILYSGKKISEIF